ncbi:MAG: tetratricopeptide repeat protein [Planctomycetota bacterium]
MPDNLNPTGLQQPPVPGESEDTVNQKIERVAALWPKALAILVILLAVTGLYKYVSGLQRAAEEEAWTAFARAEMETSRTPEKLPARLLAALDEHPDADARFYAQMRLIPAYFSDKNLADARDAAERFLQAHPAHTFAPQVRCDYARLLEWEGNWKGALEQYEAVLGAEAAYLEPEAYFGLARCHEQMNRTADAEALYIRIRDLAVERSWPAFVRDAATLRLIALVDAERNLASGDAAPATAEAAAEAAAATDAEADPGAAAATDAAEAAADATEEPVVDPDTTEDGAAVETDED